MQKRDQAVLAALVIGLLVGAAATYALAGPTLGRTTTTTVASPPATSTVTTTSTTVSTTSVVSVSTLTASSTAAFALSVRVDRGDYTANQPILVNGSVLPGPNASGTLSQDVTLVVIGPFGVVANTTSPVSRSNYSYSYALVAGASSGWVPGQYTIIVLCTAYGATETAMTQFSYQLPV
jgi:hypothetical protein